MPALLSFLTQYKAQLPALSEVESQLKTRIAEKKAFLDLYEQIFPIVEKLLWQAENFDQLLEIYQRLFREYELNYQQSSTDKRYHFILSIPIADRPEHLKSCLESIFQLCQCYAYGEKSNAYFSKISVVIVEDSKQLSHRNKDIELAVEYNNKGLKVYHFNLDEQYQLMKKISPKLLEAIQSIIGKPSKTNFYHKGQAFTRNLSYLKAIQLTQQNKQLNKDNTLYFFVDSDQLFKVNITTANGDKEAYAINYFYYINKIFNDNKIAMLTGKLVGDPPVSPSVMAVNFIDDVIAFLQQLANKQPQQTCQFHPQKKIQPSDAAYHDMAQLFGFEKQHKNYNYCCSIKKQHNHINCLDYFCQRINYFFFGEHLTRKTYFKPPTSFSQISPARTIYPGNYIINFEGLKYIIPFGELRLRMSGPTTGRLIQAEIKEAFACSNMPMLHTRTLQTTFKDEFRPGVADNNNNIDLNDEFERQFFGDLMLFSVEKLSKQGINNNQYSQQQLTETFAQVESELLELYKNKHEKIQLKCQQLSALVNNKEHWWNQDQVTNKPIVQLQKFINNIQFNFGKHSSAYQQIISAQHRQQRIKTMITALLNYHQDRYHWEQMVSGKY